MSRSWIVFDTGHPPGTWNCSAISIPAVFFRKDVPKNASLRTSMLPNVLQFASEYFFDLYIMSGFSACLKHAGIWIAVGHTALTIDHCSLKVCIPIFQPSSTSSILCGCNPPYDSSKRCCNVGNKIFAIAHGHMFDFYKIATKKK